ncbi:MAG: DUF1080 domain-containing protein [Verrucomicrobia bacterium]|nr:DUF1080 domain-containing protein [Verrucomicrobiota bacterium]
MKRSFGPLLSGITSDASVNRFDEAGGNRSVLAGHRAAISQRRFVICRIADLKSAAVRPIRRLQTCDTADWKGLPLLTPAFQFLNAFVHGRFLNLTLVCITELAAGCATQITLRQEPVSLFNGANLDGLYTWLADTKREDPRRVFTVTNGMLHISGEGLGYLATLKEFENYRLIVEFKWGQRNWAWCDRIGKARDAGIFLHAVGPDGNSHDGRGAFMAAIECNLFQGATGDFLLIRGTEADGKPLAPKLSAEVADNHDADGWFTWKRGGRRQTIETWGRLNWFGKDPNWNDTLDFRGPRDAESPPGEWTRVECICDGDRITIKVNNTVVNEAFNVRPARGKILLQCEGSEVFFRRFDLMPLK